MTVQFIDFSEWGRQILLRTVQCFPKLMYHYIGIIEVIYLNDWYEHKVGTTYYVYLRAHSKVTAEVLTQN